MKLSLHQRAAPPGQLHIWVGATDTAQAPQLTWTFNGAPAQPAAVLRPLTVIRGPNLRGGANRTFTGMVRFNDPDPAKIHRIEARANGERADVLARSVPRAVPPFGTPQKLRILLVSCYHRTTDKGNVATSVVHNVLKTKRPDLTLFLGDQVYLDLPTLQNFEKSVDWLAENFEQKYVANWFPASAAMDAGFHAILRAGPAVFTPDDHEYWNNYPHAAPMLENTWFSAGTWEQAALMMWRAFQLHQGTAPGDPVRIDVDPLSILILDTRSRRERDFSRAMTPGSAQALDAWANDLIAGRRFGILVTGQSVFENGKNWLQERAMDAVLADHRDYPLLVRAIRKVVSAGRSMICITGDVHWGRVLTLQNSMHINRLYEVISSPVSLVENVGKNIADRVRALFGREPSGPWPKHSDPPTRDFGLAAFGSGFEFKTPQALKGNQVVLLEISSIGGTALHVEATFHPLNPALKEKMFRFEIR